MTHRFERPHGEQIRHHGGEAGRQATLRYETEFQLRQADHVVSLLPVPRRNVE